MNFLESKSVNIMLDHDCGGSVAEWLERRI